MTGLVAHEIRNPLAGVSGALQVIGDRLPPTVVEAAVFDEIQQRLSTLNHLVEELLLFSRLHAPAPGRASLAEILREAPDFAGRSLDEPAPVVEATGLQEDTELVGERPMLTTLFGYLLANATAAQGPRRGALADEIGTPRRLVCLDVSAGGDRCTVNVDSGPPVASDELADYFEPFATIAGRKLGLALVIARRIAVYHGGTLTVRSSDCGGTVVSTTLPLAPARL